MTLVWEYSRFKGTRLLLMLAIADHCNDDLIAWPSRRHLANKIRMSETFTKRLIDDLLRFEPHELLLLDPGGGSGHSARYRIIIAAHENGLRSAAGMEIHKGGGGVPLLQERGRRATKKGEAGDEKTGKGGGGRQERGRRASPEPSLTPTKYLTQTATDTNAAAAVENVNWEIGGLSVSAKLPKVRREQLAAANSSGGAFVSKYLYAVAHPGFRKPALWAAAQVTDAPSAWEGKPFDSLAQLGPAGLAHVLAWMRDDGAYPLNVNGATGAALAFRAHMQHRFAKEPARLFVAIDDAITDLGLSDLAPAAPVIEYERLPPVAEPAAPNAWQLVTEMLKHELSRAAFDRLHRCKLVSTSEDGIVIAAPSQPEMDWLQNRLGKMLTERFSVSIRLEDQ